MPQTLNIIGAGKLGKTLGRLWHERGGFEVRSVCNRSLASSEAACAFIGGGLAVAQVADMPDARCWLIACEDAHIAEVAQQLGRRGLSTDHVVFHCSGAIASTVLQPCFPAALASAHPLHSFAVPQNSLQSLGGSSVTLEGDPVATAMLKAAFAVLDCNTLLIRPESKPIYHAGAVFASNYLSALIELSLRALSAAGISADDAMKLIAPIITQTLQNNLTIGPVHALTGPVVRGDASTLAGHIEALEHADPLLSACYRDLGLVCVQLAERAGSPVERLDALRELLRKP